MIFRETTVEGAFVLEPEPHRDPRGFFARTWCEQEAAAHGIDVQWVQCNLSQNTRAGTLRGMHWQYPRWEAKLVRVERGAIHDAIVDLRPSSASYLRSFSLRLDAASAAALFVPEGCAHGFMSLEDDTRVFYQMSEFYVSEQARGFHWADPQFQLGWPEGDKIVSERDQQLPRYAP